jgi:hypothetical protein
VCRLIELMDSGDERVTTAACNAIFDRAFGKPKVVKEQKDDSPSADTGDDGRNSDPLGEMRRKRSLSPSRSNC